MLVILVATGCFASSILGACLVSFLALRRQEKRHAKLLSDIRRSYLDWDRRIDEAANFFCVDDVPSALNFLEDDLNF